jgi:UDP-N-acetyl-D-mannosaminuronate dehydrogenase
MSPTRKLRLFWEDSTQRTITQALRDCDAVIICVPTPLAKTGEPDISYILSAAEDFRPHLRRGMLVVLESTTLSRNDGRTPQTHA